MLSITTRTPFKFIPVLTRLVVVLGVLIQVFAFPAEERNLVIRDDAQYIQTGPTNDVPVQDLVHSDRITSNPNLNFEIANLLISFAMYGSPSSISSDNQIDSNGVDYVQFYFNAESSITPEKAFDSFKTAVLDDNSVASSLATSIIGQMSTTEYAAACANIYSGNNGWIGLMAFAVTASQESSYDFAAAC